MRAARYLCCLILILCAGCGPKVSALPARPDEPRQLEFTVASLSGGSLSLQQFRGDYVLLHFWASWCAPCTAEISELQHFQRALKSHRLTVVAIAVESDWSDVDSLARANRITYPIGLDRSGELQKALNVTGVPLSFLVDRSGHIVNILDPLDMQLKPALGGPRPWAQRSAIEAYKKLIKLD